MNTLLRRHDRTLPLTAADESPTANTSPIAVPRRRRSSRDRRSLRLIIMAQDHLVGFLAIMGALLFICRIGFGWSPGQPNVTFHVGGANGKSDMVPISPGQVTIVTAYFDVPSKRPSSEYKAWIQHTMSLQDDMVIFATPDQAQQLRDLRGPDRKTHIVTTTLNETTLVKQYGGMEFWEHQNKAEPGTEKYLHSKELYIIWNMKSHWLQEAVDINPFSSTIFCWVDIGYLRDDLLDNKRMIRYLPRSLKENQVLMMDVRKLTGLNYLGGGFIGGYKKGITRWRDAYYKVLEANKDRFIGKDQPFMFRTCSLNPELCILVEAKNTYGDPWFHMAPYLHGVQYYGPFDHLQRLWERSSVRRLLFS